MGAINPNKNLPQKKLRRKKTRRANFRTRNQGLVKFKTAESGLLGGVNFSAEGESDDIISKKALVLVEGEHTDNSGKKHSFGKEDIEWFAEATNEFLEDGGRVPWQTDHDKKQKANIGDLEDYLVARTVTRDDLPDPRLANKLVGKLGLFATQLVGKGKDVVQQIRAGRIKTLSPGIDLKTGIIREISATPTPAIVGMSIFSHGNYGSNALTWEEAEGCMQVDESLREDYQRLTDTLWEISSNIANADDQDISMNDRPGMIDRALQGFGDRLMDLLGIVSEEEGMQVDGQQESPYAQHQTQKLSLSGNLEGLTRFKRGKILGVKARIGSLHGVAVGGFDRNGIAAGGAVYRKRRKKRKRK